MTTSGKIPGGAGGIGLALPNHVPTGLNGVGICAVEAGELKSTRADRVPTYAKTTSNLFEVISNSCMQIEGMR
jgi:hypothetical protein